MIVDSLFFRVAGVSFENDDGSSRQAYIAKLHEGDPLGLESFDYQGELAFHIITEDDLCIGSLPRDHIQFVKDHHAQGHFIEASVSEILGRDEDGKCIPGYHLGVEVCMFVYDEKPKRPERVGRHPAHEKQNPQRKVLTRKKCFVRAALWFILSGGCLFPVSVYYLLKARKSPR